MTRSTVPRRSRVPLWWLAAGLAALTVATFAGAWTLGFVNFDDPQYVTENAHVTSGLTWANVAWAFTTGHAANWHPITWLSHMLDVTLFGVAPGPAHVMSLGLHVINVALLFLVLARATGAAMRSAVVAALFAVHPLHVESVAWIAERKDVLSAAFALVALFAYVTNVRQPSLGRRIVAVAAFALGVMAKPMIVTLPIAMLLLDIWPLERPVTWRVVTEKTPFALLAAASIAITIVVEQRGGAVAPFDPYPMGARAAHAISAYVDYLAKAAWPARLAVFYPLPIETSIGRVTFAMVVLVAITAMAVAAFRRAPYVLVGWLWYIVMLLPVIGLIQVGGQAMADRYTYLPLVGIFIVVVWGVADLTRQWPARRAVLAVATGAAIAACAIAAHLQLQVWRDSLSLWNHALEVTSENYRAENAVGVLLIDQGRIPDAVAHLNEAVRLEPAFAEAHNNLGTALLKTGRVSDAMAEYQRALRLEPGLALAHNNLGLALARTSDTDDALAQIREAARLDPNRPDFHYNLAVLLAGRGDVAGARAELAAALAVRPDFAPASRMLQQLKDQ